MGQQYSSPTDGSSAATSPHNSASSSPPATRADTADMRLSQVWGSNSNALASSHPGRSEPELGEHSNLRPKTENELARMSIRAVIDTFIENCLSANNSSPPHTDDNSSDDPQVNGGSYSQSEDVYRDENNESSQSGSLARPKDGSDCPVKAADSQNSVHSQTNTVSNKDPEVIELASEDSLGDKDSNSQGQQPDLVSRDNSDGERPVSVTMDNSQTKQPCPVARENSLEQQSATIARDNSQGQQPGSLAVDNSQARQPGSLAVDNSQARQPGSLAVDNSQARQPGSLAVDNSQARQPGSLAVDNSQARQPGSISSNNSQGQQPGSIARESSQEQQPGLITRDNSQGKQPGSIARDNSQGQQPGSIARDNSQGQQPGQQSALNSDFSSSQPVLEKESVESVQKTKANEQTHGSSSGTLSTQPKTTERQTFSAYLQERLKTIDLDKHEELTQLALSKNIHCQGQMFMWEMIRKPLDDLDSASQSMATSASSFPSGPVRLQTVIDRVLDKSLLNQDQPQSRGRDDNIGKDHVQNIGPSLSSLSTAAARERATKEIQGPVPANKTRMCFKDHIEKVLLESFLSFEEEERAESLRAEARTNLQSVEMGGNKINSSLVGTSKSSIEADRLKSANGGSHRPSPDTDRLSGARSGTSKSSMETDRLKSNTSLPSVEIDKLNTVGNNRSSFETDSEKLNQLSTIERDRVNISSDGTISVQDIVDQVINQTEIISRLMTPSSRDPIKLAPPAGSSDSSVQPLGPSNQSSPGLRYQGSSHNRALLEAQRQAVHKEHQSSTTLGRKRGRPRLGSPVNTSVKCTAETGKPGYQDPRCGLMNSQVGGHLHTAVPSRDYLLSNHFSSGAPAGFSPLGTSQVMRPPALFQQNHDKLPSALFQQNHDKLPSAMFQQNHDKLPSIMFQQNHDKLPSTMFQQGHDLMQQKSSSKCLTGPASSGRQLHPHDNCHQQHGGHHYSSHSHQPQLLDSNQMSQLLDSGQMSSSNVHPQQIQVDRVKENISSSNRLVPVSHIPTKSCSCHSCLTHFSQRKSPSQTVHVQQHIHHHPFSKGDSVGSQAHQPLPHHPNQPIVSHHTSSDFYSQTISPNRKVPSPVIAFSGQGLSQTIIPSHLATQTHKKDVSSASRETAGESVCYSSGHYQARQSHISQPSIKPRLFDPRFAGSQTEHFSFPEDAFQRVTKDKDPHLATVERPKLGASPLGASMMHDTDQPLDLSIKPSPTMRLCVDSGTDRPRQDTEFGARLQPPYIHSSTSSLPPRSEASLAELEQQTHSGHHLQKLESSVDRFLLHRHSQPQLHVSLYSPGAHVPLYPQGPHFSQPRPRMSPFHAAYHVRQDVHGGHLLPHHLQEHHFSEALSRHPVSPGHTTTHPSHQSPVTFTLPPSPATQQLPPLSQPHQSPVTFTLPPSPATQQLPPLSQPHQSPVTFTLPPSPATQQLPQMSQPHHCQDNPESSAADQYYTSVLLVDSLPRSKDASHNPQSDYINVNQAHPARPLAASDYQRPPSHNSENRPEGAPSIDAASPSCAHRSPSPEDGQKLNFCKHEPIQNIIGNHPPSDILYLICLLCRQTYGSPYGFRKHFRNQHGFEPKADHTVIQTISATKTAMAHTGPSETIKRPFHPQIVQDEKYHEDLYLHGQSIKSSPGESATTAPRQSSPDPISSDDCKSDLMKELPTTTKFLECPECGQTFQLNDFGSYKRHCRQHSLHRSSGPFACHDCERSFSDPAHLQDHLATHSSFTPSVCGICRTFFSSPSYLADHLQAAHGVGSDSWQKHVDVIDNKCTDSVRKCVSEPVTLAVIGKINKSTSFSDLPVITSSSLLASSAAPSIPGQSVSQSTSSFSTTPSNHISAPSVSGCSTTPSTSNYSTTPSNHIAAPSISGCSTTPSTSSVNAAPSPSTQSAPSSLVDKQVLTRSSMTPSQPASKHQRFTISSHASHMFTVHTPKGLEIQKLPADAVVTSASPDSSYDEAKLRSDLHPGSHPYHTENVSDKGTSQDSNSSSLDKRNTGSENVPKKTDNTSDKKCDNTNDNRCDHKAEWDSSDRCTVVKSASMSQDSFNVLSPEVSELDKSYQHKKYSRHRKRVTASDSSEPKTKCQKVALAASDDSEPKTKCEKVVVTDRTDQQPFQVSSTLNSTVTVRDCESSCLNSEDSSLSWVKSGEGKR